MEIDMTREEAIKELRGFIGQLTEGCQEVIKVLVPELRESEDERTRKGLVKLLTDASKTFLIETTGIEKASYLAYLERQKELFESGRGLYYYDGEKTTYCGYPATEENPYDFAISQQEKQKESLHISETCKEKADSFTSKQKEQEPTEELVYRMNGLMQEYVKAGKDEEEQDHRLKCYQLFWDALGDSEFFKQKEQKPLITGNDFGWIDELKHDLKHPEELDEKVQEVLKKRQKPVEWSEEDEQLLGFVYDLLADSLWNSKYAMSRDECLDRLTSLRHRLQPRPSWKPSDEQMEALKEALETYNGFEEYDVMKSLYEQLKKLGVKEEPEYYQHFDPDC